jgi:hypothetical protein
MAKRRTRVHVECGTPSGFRDFKRLVVGGVPPNGEIGADGAVTVLRPDRFAHILEATGCRVVGRLAGARRRRRR